MLTSINNVVIKVSIKQEQDWKIVFREENLRQKYINQYCFPSRYIGIRESWDCIHWYLGLDCFIIHYTQTNRQKIYLNTQVKGLSHTEYWLLLHHRRKWLESLHIYTMINVSECLMEMWMIKSEAPLRATDMDLCKSKVTFEL